MLSRIKPINSPKISGIIPVDEAIITGSVACQSVTVSYDSCKPQQLVNVRAFLNIFNNRKSLTIAVSGNFAPMLTYDILFFYNNLVNIN